MAMVILDGYRVERTTEGAVLLVKANALPNSQGTWVPRAWCQDGDALGTGDTDIEIWENKALEKELDF